jgi:hypothetical protein
MGISTTKSHVAELIKNKAYLNGETLEDKPFIFASEMGKGDFFEINISASSDVRVKVGNAGRDPFGEPMTIPPILFDGYGKSIVQRVNVTESGTYQVEITTNEGVEPVGPVTLSGVLYAKKNEEKIEVLHPYLSPGTLVLLVGLGILTYGVLARPRKGRERKKFRAI